MDNEIETLRHNVDDLKAFQFRSYPQDQAKLLQMLALLEKRIEKLELNAGTQNKHADSPMWLQDAVQRGISGLKGRMTAQQVAAQLGIEVSHSNLIRLGRYLQILGVRKGRTGAERFYIFEI